VRRESENHQNIISTPRKSSEKGKNMYWEKFIWPSCADNNYVLGKVSQYHALIFYCLGT